MSERIKTQSEKISLINRIKLAVAFGLLLTGLKPGEGSTLGINAAANNNNKKPDICEQYPNIVFDCFQEQCPVVCPPPANFLETDFDYSRGERETEPSQVSVLFVLSALEKQQLEENNETITQFEEKMLGPANTALVNAGLKHRFVSAGVRVAGEFDELQINSMGDWAFFRRKMEHGEWPFQELHQTWLPETKADLILLVLSDRVVTIYAGVANLTTPDLLDSGEAYKYAFASVRDFLYANEAGVAAHEIGHLLGGIEDIYEPVFPGALGWGGQVPGQDIYYSTIMGTCPDTPCLRPYVFSHPGTMEISGVMVPVGDSEHNMAAQLNYIMPIASGWGDNWHFQLFVPLVSLN